MLRKGLISLCFLFSLEDIDLSDLEQTEANRQELLRKVMSAAMAKPGARQRLAQVSLLLFRCVRYMSRRHREWTKSSECSAYLTLTISLSHLPQLILCHLTHSQPLQLSASLNVLSLLPSWSPFYKIHKFLVYGFCSWLGLVYFDVVFKHKSYRLGNKFKIWNEIFLKPD